MNIVMGWPEWIVVFFIVINVGFNAAQIDSCTTDMDKVITGIGLLLYIIAWPSLLYWGGFF